MPIEVRELIIKAVVNSEEKPSSKKIKNEQASKKSLTDGLEEVLKLIKNRNER